MMNSEASSQQQLITALAKRATKALTCKEAKDSFRQFIELVSTEPSPARHHDLLIDKLQAVADGEIDGYSGANGGYDAWRITTQYITPVAAVSLFSGGIYAYYSHLPYLGLSLLLLLSLAVPALIIRWAKDIYERSNGADDPRGVTEAVIGALPCGLCLGVLMHAVGVML